MTEVFISAESEHDLGYAGNLKHKLEETYLFKVHLIVQDQHPNSELVSLIRNSIISSRFFIPYLTLDSYRNQWVNQEMGFAFALKKEIYPIVEEKLIPNLRGFIALTHKFDHRVEFTRPEDLHGEISKEYLHTVERNNFKLFCETANKLVEFLKEKTLPIYAMELNGVDMTGAKIYLHNHTRAVLIYKGKWHWIYEDRVTQLLVKSYGIKYDGKTKLDERKYPKGKEIHYERTIPQPPVRNPFDI